MINLLPRYIFNFVVFVLLQVLLLNNLQFSGYLNPYVYVLFIITLPFSTPKWLLLALGFITGITIDVFMNTFGLHAAATVFLAFMRPIVLRAIAPRDGYEAGKLPVPAHYGFGWFFMYTILLVAMHHLFLFYVEAFSFARFGATLWKSIVSSLFTLLFIFIVMLFARNDTRTV